MRTILVLLVMLGFSGVAVAETAVVETKQMDYQECLDSISTASSRLSSSPEFIVATGVLTIARFSTKGGSAQTVLVTCSKLDRKRVVNLSSGTVPVDTMPVNAAPSVSTAPANPVTVAGILIVILIGLGGGIAFVVSSSSGKPKPSRTPQWWG